MLASALLPPAPPDTASLPSKPPVWTRALASLFVVLAVVGVALYFVWVDLENSPNPWQHDIEDWKIPRGGPEAAYIQQLLMVASLVLAAVAASSSELLVGLRRWRWPYTGRRFFCGRLELTWVGSILWLLILGSCAYWFVYEVYYEISEIYGPPSGSSYGDDSYSYEAGNGSYSYGGGNGTSYGLGDGDHANGPPHGPGGHGGGEAKWVEALSGASRQAGLVSMIPISLLGVPLARSSALWRLAGLSYEEAVDFHRWLGILTMLLTSFHALGYLVVWWQPTVYVAAGGLAGIYKELFSEHGVAGLNPWCDNAPSSGGKGGGFSYNPECCGVSNLAGLIAWAAGIIIWLTSIDWMRRRSYLFFIQAHQLHYIFFAFTAAHWSYSLLYLAPSATFYAADIILRWHGTYACEAATARVHGGHKDTTKDTSMITLVLPIPDSAANATAVGTGGCPYLKSRTDDGSVVPLPPVPLSIPHATTVRVGPLPASLVRSHGIDPHPIDPHRTGHGTGHGGLIEPSFAHDPWAGTTCYLQAQHLSPLAEVGGWSHPFTVAGSVDLGGMKDPHPYPGATRALLVHIAPEKRWTLRLARSAAEAGGGADVRMPRLSVTSPLPAPPHLEHLARRVMLGEPLLLIGAGSGVTPGIALIRMLASRPLPPTASVRFVVVVRSMHVAEALDGYMLPSTPAGATGLPWLTTEVHLTRKATPAAAAAVAGDAPPAEPPLPSPQSAAAAAATSAPHHTPHVFRGGFRLGPASAGHLRATAAPYSIVDAPQTTLVGRLTAAVKSRRVTANEIATIGGAFGGFMLVTWPLIGNAADAPAVWSYEPTVISGAGALALGWACALACAWLALKLLDLIAFISAAYTEFHTLSTRVRVATDTPVRRYPSRGLDSPHRRAAPALESQGGGSNGTGSESSGSINSTEESIASTVRATDDPSAPEHGASPSGEADGLVVPLASDGARPDIEELITRSLASGTGEGEAYPVGQPEALGAATGQAKTKAAATLLVAAGGPQVLIGSIEATLRARHRQLHLTSLTHPM